MVKKSILVFLKGRIFIRRDTEKTDILSAGAMGL